MEWDEGAVLADYFWGQVKQVDCAEGFSVVLCFGAEANKVRVDGKVANPSILESGNYVALKTETDDEGLLHATGQMWQLIGWDQPDTPPPSIGKYRGDVSAALKNGTGFVMCREVAKSHKSNPSVSADLMTLAKLKVGDAVIFDVELGEKNRPLVSRPLWKKCPAAPGGTPAGKAAAESAMQSKNPNSKAASVVAPKPQAKPMAARPKAACAADPAATGAATASASTVAPVASPSPKAASASEGAPVGEVAKAAPSVKEVEERWNDGLYIGEVTKLDVARGAAIVHCPRSDLENDLEVWKTMVDTTWLQVKDIVAFKVQRSTAGRAFACPPLWKLMGWTGSGDPTRIGSYLGRITAVIPYGPGLVECAGTPARGGRPAQPGLKLYVQQNTALKYGLAQYDLLAFNVQTGRPGGPQLMAPFWKCLNHSNCPVLDLLKRSTGKGDQQNRMHMAMTMANSAGPDEGTWDSAAQHGPQMLSAAAAGYQQAVQAEQQALAAAQAQVQQAGDMSQVLAVAEQGGGGADNSAPHAAGQDGVYVGTVKVTDVAGGFSMLSCPAAGFNCDVYVDRSIANPALLAPGDIAAFKLCVRHGPPQASAPLWKLAGWSGQGQPNFGEYIGQVAQIFPSGSACIKCPEAASFGYEIFVPPEVLQLCKLQMDDVVAFNVDATQSGIPQLAVPCWKCCSTNDASTAAPQDPNVAAAAIATPGAPGYGSDGVVFPGFEPAGGTWAAAQQQQQYAQGGQYAHDPSGAAAAAAAAAAAGQMMPDWQQAFPGLSTPQYPSQEMLQRMAVSAAEQLAAGGSVGMPASATATAEAAAAAAAAAAASQAVQQQPPPVAADVAAQAPVSSSALAVEVPPPFQGASEQEQSAAAAESAAATAAAVASAAASAAAASAAAAAAAAQAQAQAQAHEKATPAAASTTAPAAASAPPAQAAANARRVSQPTTTAVASTSKPAPTEPDADTPKRRKRPQAGQETSPVAPADAQSSAPSSSSRPAAAAPQASKASSPPPRAQERSAKYRRDGVDSLATQDRSASYRRDAAAAAAAGTDAPSRGADSRRSSESRHRSQDTPRPSEGAPQNASEAAKPPASAVARREREPAAAATSPAAATASAASAPPALTAVDTRQVLRRHAEAASMYVGTVKVADEIEMYSTVSCPHSGLDRDVHLSDAVADPEILSEEDVVAFKLCKRGDGTPEASLPFWKLMGLGSSDAPVSFARFQGRIAKESAEGYATIEGLDGSLSGAWIHSEIMSMCMLLCGDTIAFDLQAGAGAEPEVLPPVWRSIHVLEGEAIAAAAAALSSCGDDGLSGSVDTSGSRVPAGRRPLPKPRSKGLLPGGSSLSQGQAAPGSGGAAGTPPIETGALEPPLKRRRVPDGTPTGSSPPVAPAASAPASGVGADVEDELL